MSLVDHLAELRHRLFICIIAVVIGGAIGWTRRTRSSPCSRSPPWIPTGGGAKLQFLTVSGAFLNKTRSRWSWVSY